MAFFVSTSRIRGLPPLNDNDITLQLEVFLILCSCKGCIYRHTRSEEEISEHQGFSKKNPLNMLLLEILFDRRNPEIAGE